jgi:hypothetical protein
LTRQYTRVLDSVDAAKHRLQNAATRMNAECAMTELRRVEAYRLDTLREISGHCDHHGCGTHELEAICGLHLACHELVSDEAVSSDMVA